jgi:hypothetical protein
MSRSLKNRVTTPYAKKLDTRTARGKRFKSRLGVGSGSQNEFVLRTISAQHKMSNQSRFALTLVAGILMGGCAPTTRMPPPESLFAPYPPPQPVLTKRRPVRELLQDAARRPSEPFEGEGWVSIFDGKTLSNWHETDFAGKGEVQCESGLLLMNTGDPFTGISWTNRLARMNYEVALDAMRLSGSDFFCGLTVPVADSYCSLIVGGWGGSLVGISSLDSLDASENETSKFMNFEQGRWYRVRLRVTEGRLEGWIAKEKLIDVVTTGKRVSLRPGDIELSKPFGISCWQCTSAFREIRMRRVNSPDSPPKRE